MELEHHPHFPIIMIVIKSLSFALGFVAIVPTVDLTVRVLSLIGMVAGLWLTAVIHEDKVTAKLRRYKRTIIHYFNKLF